MFDKKDRYPDKKAYEFTVNELAKRGVKISDIAQIAIDLQKKYDSTATLEEYTAATDEILHKREVLSIMMTGFAIDNAVYDGSFPEPLQYIIKKDFSLYGVDELLATGITNLYGTIGITNYGYVDKVKTGVINRLDNDDNHVNTFADDLVGALVAATAAKVAFAKG